jgi:Skp family chaperone for outer membrane proteins
VEVRTEAGRSIWAAYGESVRKVWGTVATYLSQMLEFANKVIRGVKDALMAGDLAAAVDVMWSAAKVAWISALMEIDRLTGGTFGGIFQSLAAGRWSAAGEAAMNALRQAWIAGIGFLAGLWDNVVNAADTAWTAIQRGFDVAMAAMKSALGTMFDSLKSWGAEFLDWMVANVLLPLAISVAKYSEKAAGPLMSAVVETTQLSNDIKAGIGTPEQKAAEKKAIDDELAAKQAERDAALADRQAGRQAESDAARLQREQEIAALRQRQAELAAQGAAASQQDLGANQSELDAAVAAAAAARKAAEEGRLNEKDFAISQQTESIARFSGEALGLSVGRSDDPARRTAKLSEQQLTKLKEIAEELKLTMRQVIRLQTMGGFA